ncbi:MAG: hypothetical protein PHX60_13455 [Giesbergeria sp.]|uniref:hypothetical protein n=1 Tax=Giesbergeria sp. TaxID=2818473 RepID=UPI00262D3080|nr:hypothetical protein [Giesbergeria sp.]MDD2610666.1 hypothetical protein [Giesbergeria sp.]
MITGLGLSLNMRNMGAVAEQLAKLSKGQINQALAKATNDTAFQARRAMQAKFGSAFDRVTPFIQRAPKVFPAAPDRLTASIAPTLSNDNRPTKGGKVGVDPQHVLQAQEFGGRRADKRSEVLLRRAGILPTGYQTAIPERPYPGSDDGRGNLRGPFLTQLLSYLQTFGEQGFKANMTERRKKNLERGTAKQAGRRYFVAYGKLRGGSASHLAPGIWAASGTHGSNVQPVLLFVKTPTYQPRISMDQIIRDANLQDYYDKRVRYRVRQAVERLGF